VHFEDLTPYAYMDSPPTPGLVNVGWLEKGRRYPRGAVPEGFADRLFERCRRRVNATRGYHACSLCRRVDDLMGLRVTRGGDELRLGSAEIRVEGKDGVVYAAPNLVYHYVVDHDYRPPDGFVDAVLAGSAPSPPPA
jgi:hypothetical protein